MGFTYSNVPRSKASPDRMRRARTPDQISGLDWRYGEVGATTLPLLFPSVVLRYYRSSHQTVLVLVGHKARYYLIDPGVSETVVSETGGNRSGVKGSETSGCTCSLVGLVP